MDFFPFFPLILFLSFFPPSSLSRSLHQTSPRTRTKTLPHKSPMGLNNTTDAQQRHGYSELAASPCIYTYRLYTFFLQLVPRSHAQPTQHSWAKGEKISRVEIAFFLQRQLWIPETFWRKCPFSFFPLWTFRPSFKIFSLSQFDFASRRFHPPPFFLSLLDWGRRDPEMRRRSFHSCFLPEEDIQTLYPGICSTLILFIRKYERGRKSESMGQIQHLRRRQTTDDFCGSKKGSFFRSLFLIHAHTLCIHIHGGFVGLSVGGSDPEERKCRMKEREDPSMRRYKSLKLRWVDSEDGDFPPADLLLLPRLLPPSRGGPIKWPYKLWSTFSLFISPSPQLKAGLRWSYIYFPFPRLDRPPMPILPPSPHVNLT